MHRQQAAIVRCSGVGIPSLTPRRTTAPLRASTSRRRPSSRFRAIDDRHCGGSTAACFDGMIHRIRRKRDLPRARDGDLFAGGGLKHAPSTSARSGPIPERARALTPPILAIERNSSESTRSMSIETWWAMVPASNARPNRCTRSVRAHRARRNGPAFTGGANNHAPGLASWSAT
jgi:hypothetical protein